jgi:hypothetical protein
VVDGAALEKRCAKAPRVRIPPSPPFARRLDADACVGRSDPRSRTVRCARSGPPDRLGLDAHPTGFRSASCRSAPAQPRRGRLVDYGAALEMRFGATRRGFESRPLRHLRTTGERPGVDWPLRSSFSTYRRADGSRSVASNLRGRVRSLRSSRPPSPERPPVVLKSLTNSLAGVSFRGRARRGTSGALNLQSAPAGLNSHPRSPYSNATASSDVEDRVPRSGDSRIVSGPEGSSTKRSSSGAAERPGPSRSSRRARDHGGRRWVHGISSFANPRIVTATAGAP